MAIVYPSSTTGTAYLCHGLYRSHRLAQTLAPQSEERSLLSLSLRHVKFNIVTIGQAGRKSVTRSEGENTTNGLDGKHDDPGRFTGLGLGFQHPQGSSTMSLQF